MIRQSTSWNALRNREQKKNTLYLYPYGKWIVFFSLSLSLLFIFIPFLYSYIFSFLYDWVPCSIHAEWWMRLTNNNNNNSNSKKNKIRKKVDEENLLIIIFRDCLHVIIYITRKCSMYIYSYSYVLLYDLNDLNPSERARSRGWEKSRLHFLADKKRRRRRSTKCTYNMM